MVLKNMMGKFRPQVMAVIAGCLICESYPSQSIEKSTTEKLSRYDRKCPACEKNCGKPAIIDLFCGGGGAARGLQRAGFCVLGIDINPQANYAGCRFHQQDALTVDLSGFDAVWASPPCQVFSFATQYHPGAADNHPDLVDPTRKMLEATSLPFIIENVPAAPVRKDVMLCGEMFGLRVHRHRVFETGNCYIFKPKHAKHRLKGALNNCHVEEGYTRLVAGHFSNFPDACDAMGADWMTPHELAESIPPAYSEYLGTQLRDYLAPPSVPASTPTSHGEPS